MPINASQDKITTVAATEARTFDKWWITSVRIDSPSPSMVKQATVTLQKARELPDGSYELSPVDGPVTYTIGNLDAEAATNSDLAQLMTQLITVAGTIGVQTGIL